MKIQGKISLNITIVFNIISLFMCGLGLMRRFGIWLKEISKKDLNKLLIVRCCFNQKFKSLQSKVILYGYNDVCTAEDNKGELHKCSCI